MQIPEQSGFVQIAQYAIDNYEIYAWEDPENRKSKQKLAALLLTNFANKMPQYDENVKGFSTICET